MVIKPNDGEQSIMIKSYSSRNAVQYRFHFIFAVVQVDHFNLGTYQVNMRGQQVEVRRFCFLDSIMRINIVNDTLVNTIFNITRIKPNTRC